MCQAVLVSIALLVGSCGKHESNEAGSPGSGSAKRDPWASGSGSGSAASPPAKPIADPAPQVEAHALALATCPKLAHPTYFTIEKAGKISHAVGTRHFGIGLDRIPQQIVADLKASKVAFFEIAPDDDGAVKDPDVDLPALLGAPAWNHLLELIGSDRAEQLKHAQPMYAAVLVPSLWEDLTDQLDDQLGKVAADAKIPAKGLESGLFQDQALHEVFTADVARAIIMATKDGAEVKASTVKDLGDYCNGNPGDGGFDAQTKRYFKAAGYDDGKLAATEDRLVFARTAKWVPELAAALDAGGAFIAVGADHFVGDKGLAALLAKAGYKVTPVAF